MKKLDKDMTNIPVLFYLWILSFFIKSSAHCEELYWLMDAQFELNFKKRNFVLYDFFMKRVKVISHNMKKVAFSQDIFRVPNSPQASKPKVSPFNKSLSLARVKNKKEEVSSVAQEATHSRSTQSRGENKEQEQFESPLVSVRISPETKALDLKVKEPEDLRELDLLVAPVKGKTPVSDLDSSEKSSQEGCLSPSVKKPKAGKDRSRSKEREKSKDKSTKKDKKKKNKKSNKRDKEPRSESPLNTPPENN